MRLRQESALRRLAERIEASPELEGALLLGSLAAERADALSDVDVLVVVRAGRFQEAWADRRRLRGAEALAAWDDIDPAHAEIAGHKWLTADLVLVECLLATPSSGVRLTEPFTLLVGDRSLPDSLARRPPFTRDELDDFVQERVAAGRTHEIETAYSRLAQAVRSSRTAK